jgi:hypothetical protein
MSEKGVRRAKAAFFSVSHPAMLLQLESIGSVMAANPKLDHFNAPETSDKATRSVT